MNTIEKSEELATGAELVTPILGIPGLPQHITALALKVDAKGFVQIDCSFLVEKGQVGKMQEAWAPLFAKYRLVRIGEDQPAS
jgi:hypothetical protein